MPRWGNEEEHWDDEDDFDSVDDDDAQTIPCPSCGADVYEDAQRCPRCGDYLSRENRRRSKKPLWIVLTAVLCLILLLGWAFHWILTHD